MPNRILRDKICKSRSLAALSWFEEVLFYRLIVSADDYGRFDGDPQIIKGICFPRRKDLTEKQISDALQKLSTVGLILVYEYDGDSILQLITWNVYQNIRAKNSKYPEFNDNCRVLYENESTCEHLQTYANICSRIRIRESYSYSNSESNARENARGKYSNVILSEEELARFKVDYPEDWEIRIEHMSFYLHTHPRKKYHDHLAMLMAWAEEDRKKAQSGEKANAPPKSDIPQKHNFSQREYPEGFFDYLFKGFERGGSS